MILSKTALRDELVGVVREELERAERAQRTTAEGATHSEARVEGSKDTRALEQSYLARGQAERVVELRRAVAEVAAMDVVAQSRIGAGALVGVEDEDGAAQTLLVAPHGGGSVLARGEVKVVTPTSPIGRALLGRQAGDEVEREVAGKTRLVAIVTVR